MGFILIEALLIRNPKGMSGEGVKNTQFFSGEMMGIGMKRLLSMCFITKHWVGEGTIIILRDKNVKEGEATIDFFFHV